MSHNTVNSISYKPQYCQFNFTAKFEWVTIPSIQFLISYNTITVNSNSNESQHRQFNFIQATIPSIQFHISHNMIEMELMRWAWIMDLAQEYGKFTRGKGQRQLWLVTWLYEECLEVSAIKDSVRKGIIFILELVILWVHSVCGLGSTWLL
jgi:hypothetical protein